MGARGKIIDGVFDFLKQFSKEGRANLEFKKGLAESVKTEKMGAVDKEMASALGDGTDELAERAARGAANRKEQIAKNPLQGVNVKAEWTKHLHEINETIDKLNPALMKNADDVKQGLQELSDMLKSKGLLEASTKKPRSAEAALDALRSGQKISPQEFSSVKSKLTDDVTQFHTGIKNPGASAMPTGTNAPTAPKERGLIGRAWDSLKVGVITVAIPLAGIVGIDAVTGGHLASFAGDKGLKWKSNAKSSAIGAESESDLVGLMDQYDKQEDSAPSAEKAEGNYFKIANIQGNFNARSDLYKKGLEPLARQNGMEPDKLLAIVSSSFKTATAQNGQLLDSAEFADYSTRFTETLGKKIETTDLDKAQKKNIVTGVTQYLVNGLNLQ